MSRSLKILQYLIDIDFLESTRIGEFLRIQLYAEIYVQRTRTSQAPRCKIQTHALLGLIFISKSRDESSGSASSGPIVPKKSNSGQDPTTKVQSRVQRITATRHLELW